MDEEEYDAWTRSENGRCEPTTDEVVREILGNGAIGFDPYQVVHPQESAWVLDLRLVANDPVPLEVLREHIRTVVRAYVRYGHDRYKDKLRLLAWSESFELDKLT